MILGEGRWPPCANVSPDWFARGGTHGGEMVWPVDHAGTTFAFPCPTSVHLEVVRITFEI
jgi:hypothetical protein